MIFPTFMKQDTNRVHATVNDPNIWKYCYDMETNFYSIAYNHDKNSAFHASDRAVNHDNDHSCQVPYEINTTDCQL